MPNTVTLVRTEGLVNQVVPNYLTEHDHPWLRALLDEYARFVGKRQCELSERLHEPLPVRAPAAKLWLAVQVLDRITRGKTHAALAPSEARWLVFRAAHRTPTREAAFDEVADATNLRREDLDAALFADLPGEQCVTALPEGTSPARLALDANLALVARLVRRASKLRVAAWGNARALVRHARLLGLLCTIEQANGRAGPTKAPVAQEGVVLEISGPFALFRHTEVYGRALASLLPRMAWCHSFEMVADCVLNREGRTAALVVRSGDPIAVGRELTRYDSRVEERFAKDFRRAGQDWDVIREPHPVEAAGSLVFPDFELVHRYHPDRRWLLEIMGFWTDEYLQNKLRQLRSLPACRLILCIDERRFCGQATNALNAVVGKRVVLYKTRIDPKSVLAIVEAAPQG